MAAPRGASSTSARPCSSSSSTPSTRARSTPGAWAFSAAAMAARRGSASSRAKRRSLPGTTTHRGVCAPPAGPSQKSPPWGLTPPTRARSTWHRAPRYGLPTTREARGRSPPTCPARRGGSGSTGVRCAATGRSTSPGRTRSTSGGRRGGRWRTAKLPGTVTEMAGAPPVFYATVRGKIYVATDGGVTWRDSALPGFQGQATALAASAEHPEIAYVSYSGCGAPVRPTWGVAKTTDAGRHWEPVYEHVNDAWLSERFGAGWAGAPIGLGVAPLDAGILSATDSGTRR